MLLAAWIAALTPAGLSAQGQPLPLVHPAEPPREEFSDRMLVGSDGMLVGVEIVGPSRDLPVDRLVVHLPTESGDSVCVMIRSIDGKYRGSFRFAVPATRTRAALLDVRSRRYPQELAAYTPDRLAVRAHLGASCAAPPERFVVVGRNAVARGGTLRVSLNADAGLLVGADIIPSGRDSASARCPLLDIGDAHAFNRVCLISIPTAAGQYDLRLTLRNPGQEAQFAHSAVTIP